MSTNSIANRALSALLFFALAGAAFAPVALADHGHGRSKRGGPIFESRGMMRVVHRGPCFVERRSEAGTIAGFIGGLVLGSVLSSTPPPPPAYDYYDPYCRERFGTIEAYDRHLSYHRHPRSVDVIEVHSGRCVDTLEWRDDRWYGQDERPQFEEWSE
jgi:hypothetical protein